METFSAPLTIHSSLQNLVAKTRINFNQAKQKEMNKSSTQDLWEGLGIRLGCCRYNSDRKKHSTTSYTDIDPLYKTSTLLDFRS